MIDSAPWNVIPEKQEEQIDEVSAAQEPAQHTESADDIQNISSSQIQNTESMKQDTQEVKPKITKQPESDPQPKDSPTKGEGNQEDDDQYEEDVDDEFEEEENKTQEESPEKKDDSYQDYSKIEDSNIEASK